MSRFSERIPAFKNQNNEKLLARKRSRQKETCESNQNERLHIVYQAYEQLGDKIKAIIPESEFE